MSTRLSRTRVLVGIAALCEAILWRFPPSLDIGPQPGDPFWYTALSYSWLVIHLPALIVQPRSPVLWWLCGLCDCFLLLTLLGFAWRRYVDRNHTKDAADR